eukprot:m.477188 g.477188  ORF g.477188 m.477188 type:complete len:553 (-) comp20774_c0_seq1:150-1808(-)
MTIEHPMRKMAFVVALFVLASAACCDAAPWTHDQRQAPGTAPTLSLWPAPASYTGASTLTPLASTVAFVATGHTSDVLTKAFARYSKLLSTTIAGRAAHHDKTQQDTVTTINVNVLSANISLVFGVNESYTAERSAAGQPVVITAPTVYGALRGLETVVQLADQRDTYQTGAAAVPTTFAIADTPRFAYRGLMMDYSRHFYPVAFIKHTLDAMSYSKLNVLHMHITDDQSFPMQSERYPDLTSKGAYGPQYVYSVSDMQELGAYAQDRGIILVPEFDMPAHSSSWGAGEPDIMVTGSGCSPSLFTHGDTLDPTNNKTYEVIDGFLSEMAALFPPPFLHLGGDEVPTACWAGSSRVKDWMAAHKIADYDALESYFVNRVASGKGVQASGRTLMYWEEIFNNGVNLPPSAIIQAWKTNAMPGVIKKGHRVTNSYKWYLNHGCNNYGDGVWKDFYVNDPLKFVPGTTPEEQRLVMGGETTMWGECVDSVIFDAVVWPRAAAAAEQLWSPQHMTQSASSAVARRLAGHRCRLVARGVDAAPIDDSGDPRTLNPGCQ